MQNRLWQLLVLGSLFSSQLTVQALAEELPGKPETKLRAFLMRLILKWRDITRACTMS